MKNERKIIYINYNNVEESYTLTLLVEDNNTVTPFFYSINEIVNNYPYVAEKLKEGMILYKEINHGYLGKEKNEGPYGEEKILMVEYEANNYDLNELLNSLNNTIKNNETIERKLKKIGISYE